MSSKRLTFNEKELLPLVELLEHLQSQSDFIYPGDNPEEIAKLTKKLIRPLIDMGYRRCRFCRRYCRSRFCDQWCEAKYICEKES